MFLTALISLPILLLATACQEGGSTETPATPSNEQADLGAVTLYRSPSCVCCEKYGEYLQAEGWSVKMITTEALAEKKVELGIPREMQSCHTSIIGDYFVEGHVPAEVIRQLLDERPDIDGIALPGMPAGSPGMAGHKAGPFVIYSITGGRIAEFTQY